MRTGDLQRRARESGLFYAPDPGALEQSQIGGNIATNAGGPHAFKYGVTGTWVRGLELVLASGEPMSIGGPVRKDVAGYDLRSLIVGSEGTLAIVTAAWLRLVPAPDVVLPVVAFYPDVRTGCEALATVMGSGLQPAALEYLDEPCVAAVDRRLSRRRARRARVHAARRGRRLRRGGGAPAARAARGDGAGRARPPTRPRSAARSASCGAGVAASARRSPPRAAARSPRTSSCRSSSSPRGSWPRARSATRHDLPACSWGHAGDGNLHSTFMLDLEDEAETERAEAAVQELYALGASLGGSVSGEHGLGVAKRGALALQWPEPALDLHESIKRLFDPKGLLNPGKKLARG